jgi:hypothetical protein
MRSPWKGPYVTCAVIAQCGSLSCKDSIFGVETKSARLWRLQNQTKDDRRRKMWRSEIRVTTDVKAAGNIRGKGSGIIHSTETSIPSMSYKQAEMGRQSIDG